MKYTLSIDRSSRIGSWALFGDSEKLASGDFEEVLPRSPTWFPSVLQGLASQGLKPADVDAFLVGTGPGSFSGIRAVIAALQGLALPTSTPVLGLPSAAAMALSDSKKSGMSTISVIGDARRGKLWLATYDFATADSAAIVAMPVLVDAAELPSHLKQGSRLVTPEYSRLGSILQKAAEGIDGISIAERDASTSAEDVARLHFAYPEAAVRNPLPVYLHPAV